MRIDIVTMPREPKPRVRGNHNLYLNAEQAKKAKLKAGISLSKLVDKLLAAYVQDIPRAASSKSVIASCIR